MTPESGASRLYGLPYAETLHDDIGAAYESHTDSLDEDDRTPFVIEEWTVSPPAAHFPDASDLVLRLIEDAADECGDGYYEDAEHLTRDPEVLAAAEALLGLLAGQIRYRMADKRVAEHEITWDDEDEPLLDGARLYVRRTDANGDGAAQ